MGCWQKQNPNISLIITVRCANANAHVCLSLLRREQGMRVSDDGAGTGGIDGVMVVGDGL